MYIICPIFSFSVQISRELKKEEEDQSTYRLIIEFVMDIIFFILSWIWFTFRFFKCGEGANEILEKIAKKITDNICCLCCYLEDSWERFWKIAILGLLLLIILPAFIIISIVRIYYTYQDVHGSAADFENIFCSMFTGKEGIEIDTRRIIDEVGDVTDEASESFQSLSTFLFIIIIVAVVVRYCQGKILDKCGCCDSGIGKCCQMTFCCCGLCQTSCCQTFLECIILLGFDELFGDKLMDIIENDEAEAIERDEDIEMT